LDQEGISLQVRQFLNDHITSVAQLEILLLLQTNPQQSWSPADIARELRIEVAGAAQQLAMLAASGLIREVPTPHGSFIYEPHTPELQAAVTALAQAYLIRRVTVIGLIFAKPPPSTGSIRAFSDAFKLRKDPPNA
jgi:DNA-binding MarR family transcriptional regulator